MPQLFRPPEKVPSTTLFPSTVKNLDACLSCKLQTSCKGQGCGSCCVRVHFLIPCKTVYFLFHSVHNADYYMQEAKKLKHKADALVSSAALRVRTPSRVLNSFPLVMPFNACVKLQNESRSSIRTGDGSPPPFVIFNRCF